MSMNGCLLVDNYKIIVVLPAALPMGRDDKSSLGWAWGGNGFRCCECKSIDREFIHSRSIAGRFHASPSRSRTTADAGAGAATVVVAVTAGTVSVDIIAAVVVIVVVTRRWLC